MDAHNFFKINFMGGVLECYISAPESTLLFEDIIEVKLDFDKKESKLWQLKSYLQGNVNALAVIKDYIDPEECEFVIHLSKIFNLENWARSRNIPCSIIIRGWGIKSIAFRISKLFYNYFQKTDSFKNDTPAI